MFRFWHWEAFEDSESAVREAEEHVVTHLQHLVEEKTDEDELSEETEDDENVNVSSASRSSESASRDDDVAWETGEEPERMNPKNEADFMMVMSHLAENGNFYVITMVDHFSNWTEFYPSREADAVAALAALISWTARMGAPSTLLTDRGRAFTGELIRQFCEVMETATRLSSPYHPQANGRVERMNRILKDVLKKTLVGTDWDVLLPWVQMSYNSSVHSTNGFSPFFILHARRMRLPSDLGTERRLELVEHVRDIQNRVPKVQRTVLTAMKQSSKETERVPELTFEVGDDVYYFDPSRGEVGKFRVPWSGPNKIIERISPVLYRLDTSTAYGRSNVLHINNLRFYDPETRREQENKEREF